MEIVKHSDKGLWTNLLAGATNSGIQVSLVDKIGINVELKKFKTEHGAINHAALFLIPVKNRIPAMAKRNMRKTITAITVALTIAMESFNIQRKMNPLQIVDLAETIVDDAENGDNIAIEDLMLFLQKLTRGEYGELYEGIDQIKFMKMFNQYRDERWEAGRQIANNRHLEYKSLGPGRDGSKDTALDEHLSAFTTKLQTMKDEISAQKSENKRLRNQMEF